MSRVRVPSATPNSSFAPIGESNGKDQRDGFARGGLPSLAMNSCAGGTFICVGCHRQRCRSRITTLKSVTYFAVLAALCNISSVASPPMSGTVRISSVLCTGLDSSANRCEQILQRRDSRGSASWHDYCCCLLCRQRQFGDLREREIDAAPARLRG